MKRTSKAGQLYRDLWSEYNRPIEMICGITRLAEQPQEPAKREDTASCPWENTCAASDKYSARLQKY